MPANKKTIAGMVRSYTNNRDLISSFECLNVAIWVRSRKKMHQSVAVSAVWLTDSRIQLIGHIP
jgi:hypothetical protein